MKGNEETASVLLRHFIPDENEIPDAANYYRESFLHDLAIWFTIEKGRWDGCDFVPYMEGSRNPNRPHNEMLRQGMKTSHIFAAMVYLTILSTQIVWKLLGRKSAIALCRTNGWPIFSAGLGGFLHPIQMVSEAALLPWGKKKYQQLYCDCVDKAFPIFSAILPNEVQTFFAEEVLKLKDWTWAEERPPFPDALLRAI